MSNFRLAALGVIVGNGLTAVFLLFGLVAPGEYRETAMGAMLMVAAFAVAFFGD